MTRNNLPYLFQRSISPVRELDVVGFWLSPLTAKVFGGAQVRTPERTIDCGPQPAASIALIMNKRVNSATRKVWPTYGPVFTALVGSENEGAFCCADEQQHITSLRTYVTYCRHK